jgi:hypothetical protein
MTGELLKLELAELRDFAFDLSLAEFFFRHRIADGGFPARRRADFLLEVMVFQEVISRKAAEHLRAAEAAGDSLLRQAHRIAADRYLRQLGSAGGGGPPLDPEAVEARRTAQAYAAVIVNGLH